MCVRYTREQFIEKAIAVHGDYYDYSKVIYVNNKTKVCIICPIHGEFWQTPGSHLQSKGCKKCADEIRSKHGIDSDVRLIAEKALELNQNGMTVSQVSDEIGEPASLLRYYVNKFFPNSDFSSRKPPKTLEQLIPEWEIIHDNYYDYSETNQIKDGYKVDIICPIHGKFEQRIYGHSGGRGCNECGYDVTSQKLRFDKKEYVRRCNIKHQNKYSYDKLVISRDRIGIISCPEHGDFEIDKHKHLKDGVGCPQCSKCCSKLELEIKTYLENNKIKFAPQKTFKGCRYKNLLRFDFFLPDFNLLIEAQGKQHFEPIDFFGGQKGFESNKKRDKIKSNWCKTSIYSLEYINYDDEVIPKLKQILENHKICYSS